MVDEDVNWILQHSVDVAATRAFVWAWRTDIATWRDPPARFELDGPFADGSQGRTILPGQPPLHWTLTGVRKDETFTVEVPLDRATALFEWRFDALNEGGTTLTQRIGVRGDNASTYIDQIRSGFAPTLEAGMARLAAALDEGFRAAC